MSRCKAGARWKTNGTRVKSQARVTRDGPLLATAALALLSLDVFAAASESASSPDKDQSADSAKATGKFEPFKSESKTSTGSVTIGGQTIAYQAVAGTLIVHPKGWDDVPHDPKT